TLAASPAGRTRLVKSFESPVNLATGFVARVRGYVLPPQTGSYTFWIADDAVSELWLSTDATAAKKVKIGEVTGNTPYSKWPHTHESGSVAVNLEAGRRYYLEFLQKQESGSTHFSIRWRMPDGLEERPIPAWRLAPFEPADSKKKSEEPRNTQSRKSETFIQFP